ncbi:MAG: DMT family transporter [Bacteroidetes bacterium]|nr:DMT family transporter [Bacteroidota bacterium]
MKPHSRANLWLLLASLIWGFAFVAQRQGMQHTGPLTFNAIRFLLGAASLIPAMYFMRPRVSISDIFTGKHLLLSGIMAGTALFFAASFQQVGIIYTTAGNAGFVTSLYILFVPLFGLMRKQFSAANIWFGSLLALPGLYLLSVGEGFMVQPGDLIVLIGAFFWAAHLVILSYVSPRHDFRLLAIIQFMFTALASLVLALLFETPKIADISMVALPVLYAGVLSVGVGFTLQVLGQRHARADHAALILSLEAVFAAIGGWLILQEAMGIRQLVGCFLMFAGVVVSQLPKKYMLMFKAKSP